MKISSIVVLGSGSAGLITALTLKRKIPALSIRVVRSPDIGIIGVGEGTTDVFPRHFFEYLKDKSQHFYTRAQPTWKMGIRFLWGPRREFYYTFSWELENRLPELTRNNGFYYNEDYPWMGRASAFMAHQKVFPRKPDGMPFFHNKHAFHVENRLLVEWLEFRCRDADVLFEDATVQVEKGGEGIAALVTDKGERIVGDLYVDASGFRSQLLAGAMGVPFRDYTDTLFCDRAVIGGWPRTDEPILPYTTAETMDAGWCWQIEHEHFINRGYVYSSAFISDEAALQEFLQKNPKVTSAPRLVKFRSGRYEQSWIGNVYGVGNAAGFVEPLEATALQVICIEASSLADSLLDCLCEPAPTMKKLYNRYINDRWDDIRNFLAIHYKFNTRLDTPFWRACREDSALHGAQAVVDWYRENGPSVLAGYMLVNKSNSFRMDAFLTLLVGQNVPHNKPYDPPPREKDFWTKYCKDLAAEAERGMSVSEALQAIRRPGVQWA